MANGRGTEESRLGGLQIRPLETEAEAAACARLMCSSEPWVTLGRTYEASLEKLRDETRERYVAFRDGELAGFLVLDMRGAFAGYIQTVCVAPAHRREGIGTRLIEFAEERIFRESPNVFLCVSSFNFLARKLYEKMGYKLVGALMDYKVRGHDELLFRKSLGPISAFPAKRPEV
jgi:ribosomal protein S18 acetylase RimI-like enzyme